ncbi:MAG: hypothetical protein V1861_04640 [Candidatus Micrarchaeota archaeon]
MKITLREYVPGDFSRVARVIRDGFDTLRESRGGKHPDEELDIWLKQDDEAIAGVVLKDAVVLIAEDRDTGEIAGVGGFTNRISDRLLGSTYLKGLFVREKYQRGKSGPHVGSILRDERLRRAKKMGFRKIYAFSGPEALGFNAKAGSKFYPEHDMAYMWGKVRVHYYEIELRESPLNSLRLEPYLHKTMLRLSYLMHALLGLFRVPKPEL